MKKTIDETILLLQKEQGLILVIDFKDQNKVFIYKSTKDQEGYVQSKEIGFISKSDLIFLKNSNLVEVDSKISQKDKNGNNADIYSVNKVGMVRLNQKNVRTTISSLSQNETKNK